MDHIYSNVPLNQNQKPKDHQLVKEERQKPTPNAGSSPSHVNAMKQRLQERGHGIITHMFLYFYYVFQQSLLTHPHKICRTGLQLNIRSGHDKQEVPVICELFLVQIMYQSNYFQCFSCEASLHGHHSKA